MTKLPKIKDARIDEIEDGAMDEGRFFVHLKPAYSWDEPGRERRASQSFGSRKEVIEALKNVTCI